MKCALFFTSTISVLLFSLIFVSVSVSMHEVKSGMAKEFSTMRGDFRLFSQMEELGRKIYFGKPDTQIKK